MEWKGASCATMLTSVRSVRRQRPASLPAKGTRSNTQGRQAQAQPLELLRLLLICVEYAQQSACGGRQNESETEVNHAEVRILRIPWCHIPGSASQIGILD